jgi:hypothetical protein
VAASRGGIADGAYDLLALCDITDTLEEPDPELAE